MSSKFVLAFLVVAMLAVAVMSNPPKKKVGKCQKNEVWSHCKKHCEPRCDVKVKCNSKVCIKGCVCKPGLLRRKDGRCVDECDC